MCLLCEGHFDEVATFWELFVIKPKETQICLRCQSTFELIADQHCPTCYKSGVSTRCADCLYWEERGYCVSHQALYTYNDAMKDYFSRYKFLGDYVLRQVFKLPLKKALQAYSGFTLAPVPVSPKSYSDRRFNQVEGLLEATGLVYLDCFQKVDTAKQSSKTRQERLSTRQPFSLKEKIRLPERILLIDDVYTTGTTLKLLADLCFENGVKEVKTFSLAR